MSVNGVSKIINIKCVILFVPTWYFKKKKKKKNIAILESAIKSC